MRQNGAISLDFAANFVNFYEPIEYTVNGKQLHDMEKLRVNQQFTLHKLLRGAPFKTAPLSVGTTLNLSMAGMDDE